MPDLGEPPAFPSITLPEPVQLPKPILEVPSAELPSYRPLVVPPSDLRPPPGIKSKSSEGEAQKKTQPKPRPPQPPAELRYLDVPGTEHTVPIPSNEILVTAVSTATVSVAATLTATAVFKRCVSLFKPIIKQLWTKITKKKTLSDS
mgnify:CR=1 FL=1|tara:strand:- start:6 stop:446 length:441 start_codon:yes stop_codon:yes gene_type:complete